MRTPVRIPRSVALIASLGTLAACGASSDRVEDTAEGRVTLGPAGDLRSTIENAPPGTTIVLAAGVYTVAPRPVSPGENGIRIAGRRNLTIRGAGAGATRVHFQRGVYVGFDVQSGTDGLTISDLTIEGEITEVSPTYSAPDGPAPATHGIGSHGGQTGIRNVTIERVEVTNVAVGISVGSTCSADRAVADSEYDNVLIARNRVHDIHGQYSGGGYGIHNMCASNVRILGNTVSRAERHSIYQAVGNHRIQIARNLVLDHRHGLPASWNQVALVVARSSDVMVAGNIVAMSHSRAMSVERSDPGEPVQAEPRGVTVVGNRFLASSFTEGGLVHEVWVNAGSAAVEFWRNTRDGGEPAVAQVTSGSVTEPAFWTNTQAIDVDLGDLADPRDDAFFVMQNDVLHRLAPSPGSPAEQWRDYAYSTTSWNPAFTAMSSESGELFVLQNAVLHQVTPGETRTSWPYRYSSASWAPDFGGLAALGGRAYLAQGGRLHEVVPGPTGAWVARVSPASWDGTQAVFAHDGVLYLLRAGALHRVDPADWSSAVVD